MEDQRKNDACNQCGEQAGLAGQENQPENHRLTSEGDDPSGTPSGATAGNSWGWKDVAVGAAVGTGAVVATPLVLSAAGFTAGGVAAGSVAAAAQSVLYGGGVATGSIFAALQSAGVAGISTAAYCAIWGTAGTGGVLAKKAKDKWFSSGKDEVSLDDQNNITSNQNNKDKESEHTMAMDHPDNNSAGVAGTASMFAKKLLLKWKQDKDKGPGNTMATDHPDNKTLNSSL